MSAPNPNPTSTPEQRLGTRGFLYSKPSPKRLQDIRGSQSRDEAAYKRWASKRPIGGQGTAGGELSLNQSRKLLLIRNRKNITKPDLDKIRANMIDPPPVSEVLTKEQIRARRLAVLTNRK